jgi:hypothetical protein
MNAKTLLMRDKAICDWWVSVKNNPHFETIIVLALAEAASTTGDIVKLAGARDMLLLLQTITDNPDTSAPILTSGLDHRTPKQIISDLHTKPSSWT